MELFTEFFHNTALLLSLAVLFGLGRHYLPGNGLPQRAALGGLFGAFTVVGMLLPVHLMPGVIFDGRSIVLAAAGLFGGALPAVIAGMIAGAYRLYLGGVGVVPGVGTIVSSVALGLGYGLLARRRPRLWRPLPLLALSFAVHLVVLLWMLTLPADLAGEVLSRISAPVLLVFSPMMLVFVLLLRGIEAGFDAQRRLRESENWFRHAIQEAPFPTILHAEDGEVLSVNRVWTDLSGYRPEQFPTVADWARLVYGSEREQVLAGIDGLFALDRRQDEGEFRIRTASGEQRDWFFSTAPLGRLADGRRVVISSAVDMTEQNRLRRELEFSDALVQQTQEPLYALDPEDGFRMVFVNEAACRHFGYPRERLLHMRIGDWDPNFTPEALARRWARRGSGLDIFETVHRVADGREVPVEIIAGLLHVEGRVLGIGAIHDLTERKAAQAALAEARERLERALANIPDAVLVYDADRRIRYANPAAATLTGQPVEALLGHRDEELWPADACALVAPALDQALAGATPQRVEGTIAFDEGHPRQVQMRLIPMPRGDGAVIEVLSVTVDLTGIREAEERARRSEQERAALAELNTRLQEVDRLKSMFIASMSHELRTPLNSIIGFSSVLLQDMAGPVSGEQRDLIGRVNRSGRHLLELINDVIDVSKIEAGKVEPYRETFPLLEVVHEAMEGLRPEAEGKGLGLHLEVRAAPVLHNDRRRVLQCLLNLIGNAVKYTEAGSVTVTLAERQTVVEVAVADTGIGIPAGEETALFQPFSRIDSPLTRTTLGTGLGLYLSRKVAVEILGGELGYSPVPEGGSRFTLTLPREHRDDDRPDH